MLCCAEQSCPDLQVILIQVGEHAQVDLGILELSSNLASTNVLQPAARGSSRASCVSWHLGTALARLCWARTTGHLPSLHVSVSFLCRLLLCIFLFFRPCHVNGTACWLADS